MKGLMNCSNRILKQYFRDTGAIFFSLLSMFIVIGLMVFFLGDMNINSLANLLSMFPDRDSLADKEAARRIILIWTCAGILSINAVTVTLAVYSIMIKDKASGKLASFYTSPAKRGVIVGGYILAAWTASVLICTLTLALTEGYCVLKGAQAFSLLVHGKLFLMIMVNSFAYASIMYVGAALAKSEGAWSGIGTVVGTLVGFLGGIYIPIGTLGESVVAVMKCLPVIYGTAMFRSVMLQDALTETFDGIPQQALTEYQEIMGISLTVANQTVLPQMEWLILAGCGIVFLGIGILVLSYSKKTDR